jgi:DNA-binding CsgD family transcriptional regulator
MYRKTAGNTSSYRQTTALRALTAKQSSSIGADAVAAAFNLTPAEIRTLERLLGGSSPAEIANELGVALPTVRTHLSNIFAKTGTARQLDLVLMAAEFTAPTRGSRESI